MMPNEPAAAYRIVAAIGGESQLDDLLRLSCALAASEKGEVILLHVTQSGRRPEWLDVPKNCRGVPVSVLVRTGDTPADEILAVIRHDPPDLLLMGWRGKPGRGRYLVGRNLDPLVQSAPCNVVIARTSVDRPSLDEAPPEIRRVLVPAAGGPNAALAIDLALRLSPEIEVTALNVAREVQGQVALSLARERLNGILDPWAADDRVRGKIVQSPSVVKGILNEAARDYDLVMIGASHESYLDRMLFGNIPQTIASRSPAPTAVVKRRLRRMRVGSQLRRTGWRLYEMLPTLDLHQQIEVYKALREGARPKVDFFVMIGLSAAISSFGLLLNSPAVIIGAMLVAPLMSAIFGLSLGVVRGDLRLLRRATSATIRGMLLSIAVGGLLTLLVPAANPQSEILSRTQPNLLDLGVALASGAAGAYALCRKEVSAALPGVAIAAALVPPLVTVGIGAALYIRGVPDSSTIAGGALLLFTTNLVAISAAGGLVFLWLGFRPIPGQKDRARVFQRGVFGTIAMLVAVTIPLGLLTTQTVQQSILRREVGQAVRVEMSTMDRVELEEWQILASDDTTIRLQVVARSPRTVAHHEVVALQEQIANRLGRTVQLVLSVIPSTRLDPFVPPTPTPSPPPGATATYTPSPTARPSSTPTPTPSSTATATATPLPTTTATPTATPTPTATATPTPTATSTPTPTPSLAEVGGTGGLGVWMYRLPGLGGPRITAWRDGAIMVLTGELVEADGYFWLEVIDPKGRLGWIPDLYLIRLQQP